MLAVVQARMSSTRLPGKVMLPLAGAPLLQRMVERVRAAKTPLEVCIATTPDAADDPIAALARSLDVRAFRGHPTDCLDRHYRAGLAADADVVIKIPSDCPAIDPAAIDRVLAAVAPSLDFVSNLHPPTWPDGNDVEAMSIAALEIAWREAKRPIEREHTTPFFWEHPARFRVANIAWETGRDLSQSHRLTIDYPEDYALLSAVFGDLWSAGRTFSVGDILDLFERRPDVYALNRMHAGDTWMRRHEAELRANELAASQRAQGATSQ
jgi:spore coat polysaccharide biosynthesis protein SpsF